MKFERNYNLLNKKYWDFLIPTLLTVMTGNIALIIDSIELLYSYSGKLSPYNTTSGLIMPPQLHLGIPLELNTYSALYSLLHLIQ